MRFALLFASLAVGLFFFACDDEPSISTRVDEDFEGGAPRARLDAAPEDATVDASDGGDGSIDASDEDASDGGFDAGDGGVTFTATFDSDPTNDTYFGLSAGNWVASGAFGTTANEGTHWFGSGNGNASGTFEDLGLKKKLGGNVEDHPYTVSFYVARYEDDMNGIELADFSVLRIGGPDGTMTWTNTPQPTIPGQWVKWTGTYTPAASDVGGPFYLHMVFDLDARHEIAVDGPIIAAP